MSQLGAVRVLCLVSRDGAALPELLILRVLAFPPPPSQGRERRGSGKS